LALSTSVTWVIALGLAAAAGCASSQAVLEPKPPDPTGKFSAAGKDVAATIARIGGQPPGWQAALVDLAKTLAGRGLPAAADFVTALAARGTHASGTALDCNVAWIAAGVQANLDELTEVLGRNREQPDKTSPILCRTMPSALSLRAPPDPPKADIFGSGLKVADLAAALDVSIVGAEGEPQNVVKFVDVATDDHALLNLSGSGAPISKSCQRIVFRSKRGRELGALACQNDCPPAQAAVTAPAGWCAR